MTKKNTPFFTLGVLVLTIALLSFIVLSCDDEEEDDPPVVEQPQDWTDVTIDGISGLKISTVSGTQLTQTQMNTIKSNISAAITAVRGDATISALLDGVLGSANGLVIRLETTTEYSQYKRVDSTTVLFNANHALTALNGTSFGNAINAIYGIGAPQQ
jgi:hypothetical protein